MVVISIFLIFVERFLPPELLTSVFQDVRINKFALFSHLHTLPVTYLFAYTFSMHILLPSHYMISEPTVLPTLYHFYAGRFHFEASPLCNDNTVYIHYFFLCVICLPVHPSNLPLCFGLSLLILFVPPIIAS